jgi:hypothetical protein
MSEIPEEEILPVEAAPKKKRNWFYLLLKVAFGFGAVLLIVLTVLANVGGKSETLKQSVEEFIGENTPYRATVGQFNGMTFFPDIAFDFESVEMYDKKTADLSMVVGKVQIAFGFWDVMFSTGKIKALTIEKFMAEKDRLLNPPFNLESLKITETAFGPRIEGKGDIGGEALNFHADMKFKGQGRRKKYYFDGERAFSIELGDIKITGKMDNGKSSGIVFENLEIAQENKVVMRGTLGMVRNANILGIQGTLEMAEHGSVFSPDIEIAMPVQGQAFGIAGRIDSEEGQFRMEDFTAGSRYDLLVTGIEKIFAFGEDKTTPVLELKEGTQDETLSMEGWHVKGARTP